MQLRAESIQDSDAACSQLVGRCMGWFAGNRKTGCRNRLLEQGPAVSALLTVSWAVCLPSLDLPSVDITLRPVRLRWP